MYLKFVDIALAVSGKSHLPIYSCKYSKRKYTQHQLVTLILLKEYLNVDYRSIVELVELMESLNLRIGLKEVPHYTTLHKFITRLKLILFRSLLQQNWDTTEVKAKKYCNQAKEVKLKLLVHNLDRYVKVNIYCSNEHFYKALCRNPLFSRN